MIIILFNFLFQKRNEKFCEREEYILMGRVEGKNDFDYISNNIRDE